MRFIKLPIMFCRWIAATVCCGCLLFAFHLLLQSVAQLEVEGLARRPETAEEVRGRLRIVFALFSTGFGASLVFQASQVFSGQSGDAFLSRVRKAVFVGFVGWGGVALFFCILILAAALQARWEVARSYFWLAGGAGATALLLLATASIFANGKQSVPAEPSASADRGRHPGFPRGFAP
jgi:hypothetical protein